MNTELENRIKKLEADLNQFRLHRHDGITSVVMTPTYLQGDYLKNSVVVTTLGTTPINVFSGVSATTTPTNCPFNLTVTAVYLVSNDVTAGNITLSNSGNTVATIAKGVVAGTMVGATSLANTLVTVTNQFTVVSSSAGNAQIIIIYKAT